MSGGFWQTGEQPLSPRSREEDAVSAEAADHLEPPRGAAVYLLPV